MASVSKQRGQKGTEWVGPVALAVVLLLSVGPMTVQSAAVWSPGSGWQLVWADEFSGTRINRSNWDFDLGNGGWGNEELETYTDSIQNANVVNGELVITARKEGDKYTSARLKTEGQQAWTYGKVAARIKLPRGKGIWPAFWLLGTNIAQDGWPYCGEIDVLEMVGGDAAGDRTVYSTVHWFLDGITSVSSGPVQYPTALGDTYRVYELEWTPTRIIIRIDGQQMVALPINAPSFSAFQKPMFLLLNIAVGGSWPGSPDATTVFPQTMRVDWVRVYRNPAVTPPRLPAGSPVLIPGISGSEQVWGYGPSLAVNSITVTGHPNVTMGVRASISAPAANSWDQGFGWTIVAPVAAGDTLELKFWVRKLFPVGSPTVAVVLFAPAGDGPNPESLQIDLRDTQTDTWRQYTRRFKAVNSYVAGQAVVVIQCGTAAQTLDIGGLSLINYGKSG